MRIKCPVALCGWEGKPHQFHKHIEDYKITWRDVMDSGFLREENHERWAGYFFDKIWNNPDLPEKVRWTNIAVAYVNQMKNQSKMGQHKHKKLSPDGSDKIEMHDGKVFMNGQEYTPEEFAKVMPGIKMSQNEGIHHPHIVQDITGEIRIDGMTLDEYRKMHTEQRKPK
jgi:hypothetical protein